MKSIWAVFLSALFVVLAITFSNCAGTPGETSPLGFSVEKNVDTGSVILKLTPTSDIDGIVFDYSTNLGDPRIDAENVILIEQAAPKPYSQSVSKKYYYGRVIAVFLNSKRINITINTENTGEFEFKNVRGYKWLGGVNVTEYSLGSKTVNISQKPPEPPSPQPPEPEPPQPVKGADDIQQIRNLIESGGYDARYDYNNDGMVDIKDLIIRIKKGVINHAPNTPVLLSPPNGASNVELSTRLKWSCSDPDGDSLMYDVFFGTYAPPPLRAKNISSNYYDVGDLEPGVTYYWKIVAKDDKGGVSESSTVWFKTKNKFNLIDEDFESYSLGTPPYNLGWGYCLASNIGASAEVVTDSYGKCLEMRDNTTSGYVYVGTSYNAYFDKGYLSLKIKIPSYGSNNWEVIRIYNSSARCIIDVGIGPGPYLFYSTIENGKYVYYGIEKATVDKWYYIEIVFEKNQYDVFVDGEHKGSGITCSSKFDALYVFTPNSYYGHGRVDDIFFAGEILEYKAKVSQAYEIKETDMELPVRDIVIMK